MVLFSKLIVWYLFLGGLCSGAYCALYAFDLYTSRSFHTANNNAASQLSERPIRIRHDQISAQSKTQVLLSQRIWTSGLLVILVILLAGGLCLAKDLALPEKAFLLFSIPSFSVISVGTFILVALFCALLYLIVVNFVCPTRESTVTQGVKALAAVLSIGMMIYTGIYLMGIAAVPLWSSPALPMLFLLSSCSAGISLTMLIIAYTQFRSDVNFGIKGVLLRVDIVIVVLEAIAFGIMIWQAQGSELVLLSYDSLFTGEYRYLFWGGFVFCGLVVPLIASTVFSTIGLKNNIPLIVSSCLTLVGSFFLRYCLVNAGIHASALLFFEM